jgi:hypothetical protein
MLQDLRGDLLEKPEQGFAVREKSQTGSFSFMLKSYFCATLFKQYPEE